MNASMDDDAKASRIFCDEVIKRLVRIAGFPIDDDPVDDDKAEVDLKIFAYSIRLAAVLYFQAAHEPSANQRHREIDNLHRAAEKRKYEVVAKLLRELSPDVRVVLEQRAAQRGHELRTWDDLRNVEHRVSACDTVAALTRLGGKYCKDGRVRPSGKRSRTYKTVLYAPARARHFQKREAEQEFLERLRVAWRLATKREPARTASREKPGPFVRLARECLSLVGAKHVDPVNLINDIDRRRKKEEAKR